MLTISKEYMDRMGAVAKADYELLVSFHKVQNDNNLTVVESLAVINNLLTTQLKSLLKQEREDL